MAKVEQWSEVVSSLPEGIRQKVVDSLEDAAYVVLLAPTPRQVREWRRAYGKDSRPPPRVVAVSMGMILAMLLFGPGVVVGAMWALDAADVVDFKLLERLGIGKPG